MDKLRKRVISNEVSNAIDQLNEENAKAYLRDVVSIVQRNHEDKPQRLYQELVTLFQEMVHQSNTSIPRRSLNLPLAEVGESNGQKRLRKENERVLRKKRRK